MKKKLLEFLKSIKSKYLTYGYLNTILKPIGPKYPKEGGGPNADQIVQNFVVPIRGRRVGGQPI